MKIKNLKIKLALGFLALGLVCGSNFFGGNLKIKAGDNKDSVLAEDKSLKPEEKGLKPQEAKAPKLSKEEKLKNFELTSKIKTFEPNEEILIYKHKDTGMQFIVLPERLMGHRANSYEVYICTENVKMPSGKYTTDLSHMLEHCLLGRNNNFETLFNNYYRREVRKGTESARLRDNGVTFKRGIVFLSSNLKKLEENFKSFIDCEFLKEDGKEIFKREVLKKISGKQEGSFDVVGRVLAELMQNNQEICGTLFDENGVKISDEDAVNRFIMDSSKDQFNGGGSMEFKNLDPDYIYGEVCNQYYKLFSNLSQFVMVIPNIINIPNNPNYEDILHFVEVNFIDRLKVKQQ